MMKYAEIQPDLVSEVQELLGMVSDKVTDLSTAPDNKETLLLIRDEVYMLLVDMRTCEKE